MTLLVLADDESVERTIPQGPVDAVVSSGDLADETLLRIAKAFPSSPILAVKGNHDSSGTFPPTIVDLPLKQHIVGGLRFGGFQGSWRYKPRGNYLYEQDEAKRMLADFPPVDIFVAHNSPRGVHDRDDDVHFGFEALAQYIDRAQPKLFVHGHQHVNRETQVGQTKVVGVYGAKRMEVVVARDENP